MTVHVVLVKNILHRYIDTVWIVPKNASTRQASLQENLTLGGVKDVYVSVLDLKIEDGELASLEPE